MRPLLTALGRAMGLACVAVFGLGVAPAWAQRGTTYEAVPGQPFGFARLAIQTEPGAAETIKQSEFRVVDPEQRVFYPVCRQGNVGRLLGKTLGLEMPIGRLEVFFLFRGTRPLDVTVYTPRPRRFELIARAVPPRIADQVREQWWTAYREAAEAQIEEGDFNPVVPIYLTSMLGRRLGFSLDEASSNRGRGFAAATVSSLVESKLGALRPQAGAATESGGSLALMLGLESLRTETIRAAMRGEFQDADAAAQPLPSPIDFPPTPPAAVAPQVAVEPLAQRVPAEWFYLRFGRLANQNWLNKLANEHGGDLSRMVMLRGLRNSGSQRLETQLALPSPRNALEEVVGDAMIADVALVGRDLFLNDGAAVGVMFQMRTALFASNVATHRKEVVERERAEGCVQTVERIAGRDVPFLSTPDNRRRSFFVQDGDFLLVTNSRAMAERFFAVKEAGDSLAASDTFRQARSLFPLDRGHTVFAHFSPAFFQGLLAPAYQIELNRRLRSLADRQLMELARWAATSEGLADALDAQRPDTPVAALATAGFLPPGVGDRRANGGWTLRDGRWVDDLRGAPGAFLPIPDMKIAGATPRELAWYRKQAEFHAADWRPLDPLTVAIQRRPIKPGRDAIILEARLSLNEQSKYGQWLAKLGPLSKTAIDPGPSIPIFLQANVRDENPRVANPRGENPRGENPRGTNSRNEDPRGAETQLLFVGIADMAPSEVDVSGLLSMFRGNPALRLLQATPGFVGSWPTAGFLEKLPFMNAGRQPIDAAGYSQLPLGITRRQWDAFTAIALDRRLLAPLPEQLQVVAADTPAQVRLSASDPTTTRLENWVNRISYERARQASLGNAKLLNLLHLQLQVPAEQSRNVAERLLDAELVCPVGGDYQLVRTAVATKVWRSTAWNDGASTTVMPVGYTSPVLSWFRGLSAEAEKHPDHIALQAELILDHVVPAANGPTGNGPTGNGPAINGPAVNRPSPNRAPLAGPATNRPAVTAGPPDAPRVPDGTNPLPPPTTVSPPAAAPPASAPPVPGPPANRPPAMKLPFNFNIFGAPPAKPATPPATPASGAPASDSQPSEKKPTDTKPTDSKPSDSKPIDTAKPTESKPAGLTQPESAARKKACR